MHFNIYVGTLSATDEVRVIESYLNWQGFSFELIAGMERQLKLSRGRPKPVIVPDKEPDKVLVGFFGLLEYLDSHGLRRLA